MLERITAQNAAGDILNLFLDQPRDGYLIKDITGLGPVKNNITDTKLAMLHGTRKQSSKLDKRNIVLTLGLEDGYVEETVDQLRDRLYDYFESGMTVQLSFRKENGVVKVISGEVETCEPEIFTQDPAIVVSIICFDPFFYGPEEVTLDGVSFFSDSDETSGIMEIDYQGKTPIGIKLELDKTTSTTFTQMYITNDLPSGETQTMELNPVLAIDETLKLSTILGQRYLRKVRGDRTTPMAYAVPPYTEWIQLMPGLNRIRVQTQTTNYQYTLSYKTRWGAL